MKRIYRISEIAAECEKLFGQEEGVTYDVVIPFIGFHYNIMNGKIDPDNDFVLLTEGCDFWDGTHADGRIYLAVKYKENVYRIFFDLTCSEMIRSGKTKPQDYMYPYEVTRMSMETEGSSVKRVYQVYILRHDKEDMQ